MKSVLKRILEALLHFSSTSRKILRFFNFAIVYSVFSIIFLGDFSMFSRFFAIAQLCVVFSYVCWVGGYPFLGEVYEAKLGKFRYDVVLNHELASSLEDRALLESHRAEFQKKLDTPFLERCLKSVRILCFEMPAFTRAWVLLSVVVSICLLLGVSAARQVVWLVPIVVVLGFFDRSDLESTKVDLLFPTEEVLLEGKKLEGSFFDQRVELEEAWDRYLVANWAGGVPSRDRGEFFFNVEWAKAMREDVSTIRLFSGGYWLMYLIWNFSWAFLVWKK